MSKVKSVTYICVSVLIVYFGAIYVSSNESPSRLSTSDNRTASAPSLELGNKEGFDFGSEATSTQVAVLSDSNTNSERETVHREFIKAVIEGDKALKEAELSGFSAYTRAEATYEIKWLEFVTSLQLDAESNERLTELIISFEARDSELNHQLARGLISVDERIESSLTLAQLENQLLEVLTPEQLKQVYRVDRDYNKAVADYFDNADQQRIDDGITDIMDYALAGDLQQLKSHILAGADVNAKDYVYGRTALIDASSSGHSEVVSYLIESGADIDHISKSGYTALGFAILRGNVASVQVLVDAGANIHIVNDQGISPLFLANFYETRGEDYALIAEILRKAQRG